MASIMLRKHLPDCQGSCSVKVMTSKQQSIPLETGKFCSTIRTSKKYGRTKGDRRLPRGKLGANDNSRIVLYVNPNSPRGSLVSGGDNWTFMLANHEVDREGKSSHHKAARGPEFRYVLRFGGSRREQKAYAFGSTQCNLVNAAEHSNPLIVGPESGLSQYGQSEAKNDHIEKYSRYDPNKMYSSPIAHLYAPIDNNSNGVRERYKNALLRMYDTSPDADKQNRVALIRTSQIYNIERWNNWVGNKTGPEPLSGYVGMVSLCKGATPPSANGVGKGGRMSDGQKRTYARRRDQN